MLASIPASMLNQNRPDLGIPNRIDLMTSRFSFRDWQIGVGTKRQITSTRLYVSRLMAEISLPAALMRAMASRVFSTTVAI
jgi:hypothetical protein